MALKVWPPAHPPHIKLRLAFGALVTACQLLQCALTTATGRSIQLRATHTAWSRFRTAPPTPPRVRTRALTSVPAGPGAQGRATSFMEPQPTLQAQPAPSDPGAERAVLAAWSWECGRSGFFSLVLRGGLEAGASEFYSVCFTGICSVLGVKINNFSNSGLLLVTQVAQAHMPPLTPALEEVWSGVRGPPAVPYKTVLLTAADPAFHPCVCSCASGPAGHVAAWREPPC